MLRGILRFGVHMFRTIIMILIGSIILFVGYMGSQPMQVSDGPVGMTFFEFMSERIDAAKTVEPARCGWGMISSLAVLGPVYATVYTEVSIHPDGFLAGVTAADENIPIGVAGSAWYEVPAIWWHTLERLSWEMLGEQAVFGCELEAVQLN